jgi:hypothetical protein
MSSSAFTIDLYLFEKQFQRFKEFIFRETGSDFISFASNTYTEDHEGYKYDMYRDARKRLSYTSWQNSDVGQGNIIRSVISAIELPDNNLVQWQARYGDEKRPHNALHLAINQSSQLTEFESTLYRLYHDVDDAVTFDDLIDLFGRKYPLIAYLFFLKDCSRYMPIAPKYFDQAFKLFGVDFITNQKCSWENYSAFNNILLEIGDLLTDKLNVKVSLLDSHSFVWILSHLENDEILTEISDYLNSLVKQRETVVKVRIGQGTFRDSLVKYWSTCAVTGCEERALLIASHIKPWASCNAEEATDAYNGLLLSPSLDAVFDAGYVSFSDTGKILISKALKDSDAKVLGIESSLSLRWIEPMHKVYLDYHRKHIFKG